MRQIKFRAWCPDLLEMFGQDMDSAFVFHDRGLILKTLDQIFETGSGVAVENWEYIERPKAIFMQFTGLQDKNGVDIYEGDIVDYDGGGNVTGSTIGEVVFSKRAAKFGVSLLNTQWQGTSKKLRALTSCKVIGNIHSNPELLEQSL